MVMEYQRYNILLFSISEVHTFGCMLIWFPITQYSIKQILLYRTVS